MYPLGYYWGQVETDDKLLPKYSRERKKLLKLYNLGLMNCGTPLRRSLSRDTKHKWAIEHR